MYFKRDVKSTLICRNCSCIADRSAMVWQEPPFCHLRWQRRIPWREPLRIFGEGRGADHQEMCESRIRTGRKWCYLVVKIGGWPHSVLGEVTWSGWNFWIDQDGGAGVSGGQPVRSFVVWRNHLVPLKTLGMQGMAFIVVGKAGWRKRMEGGSAMRGLRHLGGPFAGEFVPADLRVGRIYRNDKHRLWNFAGVRC